ncbi:MoaD/ThiS family protein [Mycolicibacterium wolinskyi]|uniref:Molybdopterin synthase sulfur carrier subunit n=1 Tax=Mycolicibacterium wolinskyi TaxID=59750 RepID=A0A132PQM1_9MYCO|nr:MULTISPECIES: MoaD/ThiS family protein [Mycolicibacterium]KWX24626.1 molybdenum cofactor biosynthesis protein MoaD [Mycolicibacterium wolinskyi]MCV7290511.1 MoaD/ThiS family protein [Mycolicibacterium wolinskyi]MCV7297071.1 MoaD/ThiS family protein [Mycolicibacterium goodii]ORX15220.1 molybdopterin synthase sulfur carrier subunit [Mycolicibacterium wolinskyi]
MTATTTVQVTIRYFAAAAAAAGVETETLDIATGTTISALIEQLAGRNPELARVLKRCSYLCDGVAVRDIERAVLTPQTLDVLPPFAGG